MPLHEKLLVKDDPNDLRASVDPENLLVIESHREQVDRFSLTSAELQDSLDAGNGLVDS